MKQVNRILNWASLLIAIGTIVYLAINWNALPAEIPQHYNGSGKVDAMGDKGVLILLVFVLLLILAMSKFCAYLIKLQFQTKSADNQNERYKRIYFCTKGLEVGLAAVFSYIIIMAANGKNLSKWLMPIVFIGIIAFCVGLCTGRQSKIDAEVVEISDEIGNVYRSKVDWWIGILLWGCVISTIPFGFFVLKNDSSLGSIFSVGFYIIAMLGLVLPILVHTKYTLYSNYLQIESGFFGKLKIPYTCIESVKPTHNPLSSAALSTDRLEIRWCKDGKHDVCMISPVHKSQFQEQLKRHRSVCQ